MADSRPRPLYYTFGNHMHWVDMQWLWGYGVLPGSVADMLRLVRETGARGNVNFDGVGYEKMAAECPEALADLRAAVLAGTVEPVGCSYGQPYGLFHGGESNCRQLTYGVRAVRRLLGVRARTFWEEEFYFFPQLPQMLAQCGFTGAGLFFQWTWHTPEVPLEAAPLVMWEGADGTRIAALTRNALNIHQWPEELDGLLERAAQRRSGGAADQKDLPGAVAQWLELMPTRDWMCRSELLIPRLKELMADARFEVRARTAGGVIGGLLEASGGAEDVPVRAYSMDEVWHGMTLGKNGDAHPRSSRAVEKNLVTAEAMAALLGLFGRPYPSWDVYPTWELEESWRELLAAQHHDNHECEGLCGGIGEAGFRKAGFLSDQVQSRCVEMLTDRVDAPAGHLVAFNATGRMRDLLVTVEEGAPPTILKGVPPFGYAAVRPGAGRGSAEKISIQHDKQTLTMTRGQLKVTIDKRRGVIRQIVSDEFPRGVLDPERPLGTLSMVHGDGPDGYERAEVEVGDIGGVPIVQIMRQARDGSVLVMGVKLVSMSDGVDVSMYADLVPRSEARMHSGLQTPISPVFPIGGIVHDHPFGIGRVEANGVFKRKYPTGDWMTSPQVFEEIRRPFTALRFVDLLEAGGSGRGLLCLHGGAQQWFRDEHGVRNLLTVYDAWDQERYNGRLEASLTFIPHGPLSDAQRAAVATSTAGNWNVGMREGDPGDVPAVFGPLAVDGAPGVEAVAFFRESMKSGEHLPEWAGHRMFNESGGACDHPYVLRLVEWTGEPAEVVLKLPGRVAMAAKTNLMGEVHQERPGAPGARGWTGADTGWLAVERAEPPPWAAGATFAGEPIGWSQVRVPMRPREIATVMADLEMGRKQWRDLDARREVWARVHRVGGG